MTSPRVPLLLQPANPPVPFVGRAAESARLATLIERGPIAIVCGLSGVGKSGVLTATLATRFADERERTVVVDANDDGGGVAGALRALQQIGVRPPAHDAPAARRSAHVAHDPRASTPAAAAAAGALVEALESEGLWLLVENLERIDDELREALTLAQRHCRRARILCVVREDPRAPALAPHTITIGALSAAELRALLDEIEPGLSETEAAGIVAHAKGSPWRLRQLSLGGVVDEAGPEKSLLMLAPVAVGLLRTLALLPSSVPQPVLARATRLPSNDAVESLARRGYVEISARGVRLHDAARPLVEALLDADERAARAHKLARAIADAGSAELGAAALGLLRAAGDADAVRIFLERHGAALCDAGHAAALLDVVTHVGAAATDGAPALEAWACRLALDAGGDALVRAAVRADDADDADAATLALRAAVLAARGELARACAVARAALAARSSTGGPDAGTALRALEVLLCARDDDGDRAILAGLRQDALASEADAVRRAALAHTPDGDGDALVHRFARLPREGQHALVALVARALRTAGDARGAQAVLAMTPAAPADEQRYAPATASARAAELERAHVALALGDLAGAGARFARAAAAAATTPLDNAEARLGALAVRLARGELRGVDAELAAVVAVVQEREAPPALARMADALTTSLALLAGKSAHRPVPSLEEARKARARARDAGLVIDALDAAVACIDAAIIAGDRTCVAVEAEQLAAASASVGSRRYALHARFGALAARDGAEASAFVQLAQAMQHSPIVARRATALLGEAVPLDDVDRAVLAAMPGYAARPPPASVVRQAAGPEWTVDAATMRIILVDGRTVELAHRKVLFDVLATLCANGGAATKEQLLERAWGVRDYHPLRHDNRLKVAVRKLRRLLEETLGDDPIESADDGYRLRGKVRFLRG